jgi:LPS export ABC transporter protein LptC
MLIVVVGALIGIGYQAWRSATATRTKSGRELRSEIPPGVAQHIRDFRRVKMKHGRPVWEIQAAEAQYFEDEDEITVREPRVVFYLEDGGRRAALAGSEGRMHLDQQELESVTVRGSVRVSLDDVELETDEASYERERDIITAPGPVTIRGRTVDVRARGMEVEITPQHVRLLADVHTVLRFDDADS